MMLITTDLCLNLNSFYLKPGVNLAQTFKIEVKVKAKNII
jgi:hypothetical protein